MPNNFNQIILEDEQLELLYMLVEAARNTPRDRRQKFSVIKATGGDVLIHPGLGENRIICAEDVEFLANYRLLSLTINSQGSFQFNVTPIGFKFYEIQKRKIESAGTCIENSVKKYVNTIDFEMKYPKAYKKWIEAENLLWSSESDNQFTLIGHMCREAIQEFIQHLVEKYKIEDAVPDKSKTISRLRLILDNRSDKIGKTVKSFAETLLVYWGTLNDLVQRQEHGGQKEGTSLNWEDSRRVVFHPLIVMYEIDRTIL